MRKAMIKPECLRLIRKVGAWSNNDCDRGLAGAITNIARGALPVSFGLARLKHRVDFILDKNLHDMIADVQGQIEVRFAGGASHRSGATSQATCG